MAQQSESDIPSIYAELVPGPLNGNMRVDFSEQLRLMQNSFANAVTEGLETSAADTREGAKVILQALQGDAAAQQHLTESAKNSLNALTDPHTLEALRKSLQADFAKMQLAYEQNDVATLGALVGTAFVGAIDPKNKLKIADDLGNIKNHSAKPWAGDTNPSQGGNHSGMHNRRPLGDVEVDGVVYSSDGTTRQVKRLPLELEPIDKADTLPARNKPVSAESTHRSGMPEDDHMVRNTVIATTVVAGVAAAAIVGKPYLDDRERSHRVALSNTYKMAVYEVLDETEGDRLKRYEQAVEQHPELNQAIKGYESVRKHLTEDGNLTEKDQSILALVAYNTNLTILDGHVGDIKVDSQEFVNPGHEREDYSQEHVR